MQTHAFYLTELNDFLNVLSARPSLRPTNDALLADKQAYTEANLLLLGKLIDNSDAYLDALNSSVTPTISDNSAPRLSTTNDIAPDELSLKGISSIVIAQLNAITAELNKSNNLQNPKNFSNNQDPWNSLIEHVNPSTVGLNSVTNLKSDLTEK